MFAEALGVVQVRKSYEERRRRRHVKGQGRSWKLKRMNMDSDDTMQLKKGQQAQADKRQQDLERFMQVAPFHNYMCSVVAVADAATVKDVSTFWICTQFTATAII